MRRPLRLCGVLLLLLSGGSGCQGLSRVFYRAGAVSTNQPTVPVLLVSEQVEPRQPAPKVDPSTMPQKEEPSSPQIDPAKPATPAEAPASEPPKKKDTPATPPPRRGYTVPSVAAQQMALAALGTTSGSEEEDESDLIGGGKEASEASGTAIGQAGLSAPQPIVAGVALSQPGLQEGVATALGPAATFNVFTNPPRTRGLRDGCAALNAAHFNNVGLCQSAAMRQHQRSAKFTRK
jgi:hypothetical protein